MGMKTRRSPESVMQLSAPHRLFLKAHRHNWDHGLGTLEKILADEQCERGTALLIYWRGQPGYFNRFTNSEEMSPSEKRQVRFLRKIEESVAENKYPARIRFVPTRSEIPDELGQIPAFMTHPSEGEIEGADLIAGKVGEMRLISTCAEGNVDRVEALLTMGYGVNERVQGKTPIEAAVEAGAADVVRLLIARGADFRRRSGDSGFTPLHRAVFARHLDCVATLLEHGVDINAKASWRRSSLHAAMQVDDAWWDSCGMEPVARFLVANGIDLESRDVDGKTPLDLARQRKNDSGARLLLELGASDDSSKQSLRDSAKRSG